MIDNPDFSFPKTRDDLLNNAMKAHHDWVKILSDRCKEMDERIKILTDISSQHSEAIEKIILILETISPMRIEK